MSTEQIPKSTFALSQPDLALRDLEKADLEDVKTLFHSNIEHFGKGGIIADDLYDRIEDELTTTRPEGIKRMGIWLSERLVGYLAVIQEDMDDNEVEISYALDKDHTRRGIAKVAVQAVTDYETESGKDVVAEVESRNQASMRLLESLGYMQEQRMRDGRFVFKKDATDFDSLMRRLGL